MEDASRAWNCRIGGRVSQETGMEVAIFCIWHVLSGEHKSRERGKSRKAKNSALAFLYICLLSLLLRFVSTTLNVDNMEPVVFKIFPFIRMRFLQFQREAMWKGEKGRKRRKGRLYSRFFRAKRRSHWHAKMCPSKYAVPAVATERCSNVVKSRAALRILRSPTWLSGRSSKRRCTVAQRVQWSARIREM